MDLVTTNTCFKILIYLGFWDKFYRYQTSSKVSKRKCSPEYIKYGFIALQRRNEYLL